MMDEKIRVGITHGDFNGIGYEVIVKALAADGITELMTPVVFCDRRLFDRACKEAGVQFQGLNIISSAEDAEEAWSILWISAFRTSVSLPDSLLPLLVPPR